LVQVVQKMGLAPGALGRLHSQHVGLSRLWRCERDRVAVLLVLRELADG
jgi:hypothetical protein